MSRIRRIPGGCERGRGAERRSDCRAGAVTRDEHAPGPSGLNWFNLTDTLGLPAWAPLAFAAIPTTAAAIALVNSTSSLAFGLELLLLAIALSPFYVNALPVRYGETWLVLVALGALALALAEGGDRVVLWIPGFMILRTTGLSGWRSGVVVLVASVGVLAVAARTDPGTSDLGLVLLGYGAAMTAGLAARQITILVEHLRETEQQLAADAARDERRRLAREVHDVIAHSMTITLLHLQGARLACQDEPENVEMLLEQAERLGRASLDDLRRTVRLLSDATDPSLDVPVEFGDDLRRLVDSFTSGGTDIALHTSGDLDLPPVVAQGLFRILQESLTNAVRHAPDTPVEVSVEVGERRIELRVSNGLPAAPVRQSPPGAGHGLPGVLERAAMLGGRVEAGPTKTGWIVRGWVPRHPPDDVVA